MSAPEGFQIIPIGGIKFKSVLVYRLTTKCFTTAQVINNDFFFVNILRFLELKTKMDCDILLVCHSLVGVKTNKLIFIKWHTGIFCPNLK